MTKSTITREQAQKIIVAADEVITALAGTNEDVHPDDSKKMCELWDDLNDRYAPPVVVRELARMALAAMDSEPVAYTDERNLGYIDRGRETAYLWGKQNYEASDVALYRHAQPAPELAAIVERLNLSGYEYEGGEVTPQNAAAIVDTLLQQLDDEVQGRNAQPAPVYPETLPCPVLLEPGMRFGKALKPNWCWRLFNAGLSITPNLRL